MENPEIRFKEIIQLYVTNNISMYKHLINSMTSNELVSFYDYMITEESKGNLRTWTISPICREVLIAAIEINKPKPNKI